MEDKTVDGKPQSRAVVYVTAGAFFLAGAVNLLLREWLIGAAFLTGGLIFLSGERINRLPKAARYLITVLYVALAVAMLVESVIRLRAHR
jgi:hypothetical protein